MTEETETEPEKGNKAGHCYMWYTNNVTGTDLPLISQLSFHQELLPFINKVTDLPNAQ